MPLYPPYLDAAAADIQPAGTTGAAGSTGKAADAGHVHATPLWTAADSGLLAWNYDLACSGTGGSTPLTPAGTVFVQAVAVRQAISVTNILVFLLTNGATLTSGQCFAALYQGAGGALIGTTADQSANWGAGAAVLRTMPLSGGPFSVAAGIAYVAFWYNGTTGPAFAKTVANASQANMNLAAGSSRWGTANSGVTTTAPSTLGAISAAATAYWVGLS